MAFLEIRFPEDLSLGAVGGPKFKTNIVQSEAGFETRTIVWDVPLGEYDVSHNVETEEDMQRLNAFFRIVRGRGIGFRFRDWTDYKGLNQLIGTGNGARTVYQLRKGYTFESYTAYRIIKKVVEDTVKIYFEGVEQPSSKYVCNYNTGVITFTAPPPASGEITADFEFDVPVRFDVDNMPVSADESKMFSWGSISLVEVRI